MKKLKEEKERYDLNEYELFEKTIGFSVSYRIFLILYLSWEDSRKYTFRDIEDLHLRKTYYSTESRKDFYNLILSDMFANFLD